MLSTTPVLQLHCLRLLYVHVRKPVYLLQLLSQEFTHLSTIANKRLHSALSRSVSCSFYLMPLRMTVLVCDAAQGSQYMRTSIPLGTGDAFQLAIKS
jgi:hypothetical protein